MPPESHQAQARVDLYWLPLGAGDRVPIVHWNGRMYEAIVARRQRRPAADLYHAALQLTVDGVPIVIEMAPVWSGGTTDHGVVVEGPVGFRWLGRSRLFRYGVRRWRGGEIPDLQHAVGGPRCMTTDPERVQLLLDLVPDVPVAVWGRDEFGVGDMWNSNSVIAWLLVRSGLDVDGVQPPDRGRAPGWTAGLVAAAR